MLTVKRIFSVLLCLLCVTSLCACGKEAEPTTPATEAALQIGNPWVSYET